MYQEWLKKYEEITKKKSTKTDIENMKDDLLDLKLMLGKKPSISTNAIENALKYMRYLENKVQELGRAQHILMQSRRKWKNRYYKERQKRKDIQGGNI